jgi:hypothetical protein
MINATTLLLLLLLPQPLLPNRTSKRPHLQVLCCDEVAQRVAAGPTTAPEATNLRYGICLLLLPLLLLLPYPLPPDKGPHDPTQDAPTIRCFAAICSTGPIKEKKHKQHRLPHLQVLCCDEVAQYVAAWPPTAAPAHPHSNTTLHTRHQPMPPRSCCCCCHHNHCYLNTTKQEV